MSDARMDIIEAKKKLHDFFCGGFYPSKVLDAWDVIRASLVAAPEKQKPCVCKNSCVEKVFICKDCGGIVDEEEL